MNDKELVDFLSDQIKKQIDNEFLTKLCDPSITGRPVSVEYDDKFVWFATLVADLLQHPGNDALFRLVKENINSITNNKPLVFFVAEEAKE